MTKRYIVDLYDAFDGWCHMSEFYGWEYDTIESAKKKADELVANLYAANKKAGEHYGVIDTTIMREIYCTQEGHL